MFLITKTELTKNLKKIQEKLCCYSTPGAKPPSFCDCKYGVLFKGESTGCPEVRGAVELFEIMTPKEYNRLCNRLSKKDQAIAKKSLKIVLSGRKNGY